MAAAVTIDPSSCHTEPRTPCPTCGSTPETAQGHTAPNLADPDSPAVQEALTRKCDQCHAPIGRLCVTRPGFRADLTGRLIHLGRMCPP